MNEDVARDARLVDVGDAGGELNGIVSSGLPSSDGLAFGWRFFFDLVFLALFAPWEEDVVWIFLEVGLDMVGQHLVSEDVPRCVC